MCKLKSAIVLKDRVFCPDYNSHDRMLEELGINDTLENASSKFVRVELSPANGDPFVPVKDWKIHVDQDIRPDWFLEEAEEPRVREAVEAWAQTYIFCNASGLELKEGKGIFYIKNSAEVKLCGQVRAVIYNSSVDLYDDSYAELFNESHAKLYDCSQATLRDNSLAILFNRSSATLFRCATAELHDNSLITLYDISKASLYDNSKASLFSKSQVNLYHFSRASLYDNSKAITYEDSYAELYHSSTVTIYDRSEIEMHNDSIGYIRSSAYKGHFTLTDKAVIMDYSNKTLHQSKDQSPWKLL